MALSVEPPADIYSYTVLGWAGSDERVAYPDVDTHQPGADSRTSRYRILL